MPMILRLVSSFILLFTIFSTCVAFSMPANDKSDNQKKGDGVSTIEKLEEESSALLPEGQTDASHPNLLYSPENVEGFVNSHFLAREPKKALIVQKKDIPVATGNRKFRRIFGCCYRRSNKDRVKEEAIALEASGGKEANAGGEIVKTIEDNKEEEEHGILKIDTEGKSSQKTRFFRSEKSTLQKGIQSSKERLESHKEALIVGKMGIENIMSQRSIDRRLLVQGLLPVYHGLSEIPKNVLKGDQCNASREELDEIIKKETQKADETDITLNHNKDVCSSTINALEFNCLWYDRKIEIAKGDLRMVETLVDPRVRDVILLLIKYGALKAKKTDQQPEKISSPVLSSINTTQLPNNECVDLDNLTDLLKLFLEDGDKFKEENYPKIEMAIERHKKNLEQEINNIKKIKRNITDDNDYFAFYREGCVKNLKSLRGYIKSNCPETLKKNDPKKTLEKLKNLKNDMIGGGYNSLFDDEENKLIQSEKSFNNHINHCQDELDEYERRLERIKNKEDIKLSSALFHLVQYNTFHASEKIH